VVEPCARVRDSGERRWQRALIENGAEALRAECFEVNPYRASVSIALVQEDLARDGDVSP